MGNYGIKELFIEMGNRYGIKELFIEMYRYTNSNYFVTKSLTLNNAWCFCGGKCRHASQEKITSAA